MKKFMTAACLLLFCTTSFAQNLIVQMNVERVPLTRQGTVTYNSDINAVNEAAAKVIDVAIENFRESCRRSDMTADLSSFVSGGIKCSAGVCQQDVIGNCLRIIQKIIEN